VPDNTIPLFLALEKITLNRAVSQGWLKHVEADGAQREMENFEVALDGNIIAREPNGDVIEMSPPGWQVWMRQVLIGMRDKTRSRICTSTPGASEWETHRMLLARARVAHTFHPFDTAFHENGLLPRRQLESDDAGLARLLALDSSQGWLKHVEADGAQREMENFEVALDGNIIAREPNGDVIEMSPPGWQVCMRQVLIAGASEWERHGMLFFRHARDTRA